jgi:hypothetical protein
MVLRSFFISARIENCFDQTPRSQIKKKKTEIVASLESGLESLLPWAWLGLLFEAHLFQCQTNHLSQFRHSSSGQPFALAKL